MFRIFQRCFLLAGLIALGASAVPAQVGRSLGVIDPNVAQARDLLSVTGLTPEMVKAILDARPFMSMAEFDAFLGRNLDRDQRSMLYVRLFLPINVNATTDEELRLVPGMGAHLLVDFKENRPFGSLASLSQEISKYLPPKDAARLAQYVFVPLDVNTASDDDLRTIPGMTPKLLATIRQHRPYRDHVAFIKAIRKTVSAKEATRLSTFVRTAATS
jgi:DNA uptake protein ComE-like DNA-binding protein